MALLNATLLKQSYRLALQHWRPLVAVHVGSTLLLTLVQLLTSPDLVKLNVMGQLPEGYYLGGPEPEGLMNPSSLYGSLGLSIGYSLVMLLVWMYVLRSLSQGIPLTSEGAVAFAQRHAKASFRGFWGTFWRLVIVMLGATVLFSVLGAMMQSNPSVTQGIATLIVVIVPVALAFYLLPFIYASYYCIFHDPVPFKPALEWAKQRIRGRRLEMILTLLVALIPAIALGGMLDPGPLTGWLEIVGTCLLQIPFIVLNYLYFETFEHEAPETNPISPIA